MVLVQSPNIYSLTIHLFSHLLETLVVDMATCHVNILDIVYSRCTHCSFQRRTRVEFTMTCSQDIKNSVRKMKDEGGQIYKKQILNNTVCCVMLPMMLLIDFGQYPTVSRKDGAQDNRRIQVFFPWGRRYGNNVSSSMALIRMS